MTLQLHRCVPRASTTPRRKPGNTRTSQCRISSPVTLQLRPGPTPGNSPKSRTHRHPVQCSYFNSTPALSRGTPAVIELHIAAVPLPSTLSRRRAGEHHRPGGAARQQPRALTSPRHETGEHDNAPGATVRPDIKLQRHPGTKPGNTWRAAWTRWRPSKGFNFTSALSRGKRLPLVASWITYPSLQLHPGTEPGNTSTTSSHSPARSMLQLHPGA